MGICLLDKYSSQENAAQLMQGRHFFLRIRGTSPTRLMMNTPF